MLRLAECRFATLLDVQVAPDLRSLILLLDAEVPDGPQGDLMRLKQTLVRLVVEGVAQVSVQRRPELPQTLDDPLELPPSKVASVRCVEALDEWERACYDFHLTAQHWRIQALAQRVVVLPGEPDGP